MAGKLTAKQEAFVREYLIDLNASAAARRAGYSPKTADRTGYENLRKPEIAAAIEAAQAKRSERVQVEADDVLKQLWLIASADPTELVRVRVSACRHCHGVGHQYQWMNEHEFHIAYARWQSEVERAERDEKPRPPEPTDAGGYGFHRDLEPHPDCPACLGDGHTDVLPGDTGRLSEAARSLYAGAKVTQAGFEVKTKDQMRAIELLGKHLGMFTDRVDHTSGGKPLGAVAINVYLPDNERDEQGAAE